MTVAESLKSNAIPCETVRAGSKIETVAGTVKKAGDLQHNQ